VVVYDNLVTGHRELGRGFPLIVANIAARDALRGALNGVDAVVHLAASAYVRESIENPRKYFRNNVESALQLLDGVLEQRIRILVFSSSCAIYGVPASLPVEESFPTLSLSPYGETKLFLERFLSRYSQAYGLCYVALRYFKAAGAHTDGSIGEYHEPETHLVPLALRSALGEAPSLGVFVMIFLPMRELVCATSSTSVTWAAHT
jgi:UDP-glucose 4-epimerase